ncbi:MAG: Ig-like domain-containing protein, partial [bacterium]|nr:Ig-like domain-containing protein [bacterium]
TPVPDPTKAPTPSPEPTPTPTPEPTPEPIVIESDNVCTVTVTSSVVTELTLSSYSANVVQGANVNLRAFAKFEGSDELVDVTKQATWNSNNSNVAYFIRRYTDEGEAIFTVRNAGNVQLYATYGNQSSSRCYVSSETRIYSLEIEPLSMQEMYTDDAPVQLKVYGITGSGSKIDLTQKAGWSAYPSQIVTLNKGLMSVDKRCRQTENNITITAQYTQGDNPVVKTSMPLRQMIYDPILRVTVLSENQLAEDDVDVGATLGMVAQAVRASGVDFNLEGAQWSSSSTGVATVDDDGQVKGKTVGSTDINVTYPYLHTDATGFDGITKAKVNVVSNDILDLRLSATNVNIGAGGTYAIYGIGTYAGGAEKDVKATFSSANNNIATVNADSGIITGANVSTTQTTTITGTYMGKSATCSVTVKPAAQYLGDDHYDHGSISPIPLLAYGQSFTPKVYFTDDTGADKTVPSSQASAYSFVWKSSDDSVLTCNATTGVCTAKSKAGIAKVTLRYPSLVPDFVGEDGFYDECITYVTVVNTNAALSKANGDYYRVEPRYATMKAGSAGVPLKIFAHYANGWEKDVTSAVSSAVAWWITGDYHGSMSGNTYRCSKEGADSVQKRSFSYWTKKDDMLTSEINTETVGFNKLILTVNGSTSSANLDPGMEYRIETSNNAQVQLTVDDPTIASVYRVDDDDPITYILALRPGATVLRARAYDGTVSTNMPVIVSNTSNESQQIEFISIDAEAEEYLSVGASRSYSISYDDNGVVKSMNPRVMEWHTSDPAYVTVDNQGLVTAKKATGNREVYVWCVFKGAPYLGTLLDNGDGSFYQTFWSEHDIHVYSHVFRVFVQ